MDDALRRSSHAQVTSKKARAVRKTQHPCTVIAKWPSCPHPPPTYLSRMRPLPSTMIKSVTALKTGKHTGGISRLHCVMYQLHPLNVNGKLIRRFYEPLVLLSVLDPVRGAIRPDLIADHGLDDSVKLWRNFLDRLCWLCDFNTGGDTVTSVAVEMRPDRPCFWIATNSLSAARAQEHIKWLLHQLEVYINPGTMPVDQVQRQILACCIEKCSPRIKAYTRWLLQAIREAQQSGHADPEDLALFHGLTELVDAAKDPVQLCTLAAHARQERYMEILFRRHHALPGRSIWSDIRHYIGRLGSYRKAVHTLCLCARRFPQRIEHAEIRVVTRDARVDRPNSGHSKDLIGTVNRILTSDASETASDLLRALTELERFLSVEETYLARYASLEPRPHAELLVLEHFHQNDLAFISNDRYIGCSKPSCYCCHLYMQVHDGFFIPRPCHGNLWTNWAPPIPLPLASHDPSLASRPQDHHTFKMLQLMLPKLRQELREQILSRRPKRGKVPDSSSGMSSVIFEFSVPLLREHIDGHTPTEFDSATESDVDVYSPELVPDSSVTVDVEEEDVILFTGRRSISSQM